MARNFRVCAKEIYKQSLALKLFGDFDVSSACKLLHVLTEIVQKYYEVVIDTDGLITMNMFGLDVFHPQMNRLNKKRINIETTGRFSDAFLEA